MSADSTPASIAREAESLLASGRFEDAYELCKRALRDSPDDARLLATLGRSAHGQGRFAEAADFLEQASAAGQADPDVLNDLGRALNNLRQWDGAGAAFRAALTVAPERADLHNNLGHVYRGSGKLQEAVDCFMEAVRLDPELAAAHNNLGTSYMLLRRPLQAARSFRKFCELAPGNARAFANLALALHTAGRLQQAQSAYQKALEIEPGDADTWLALGLVCNELRDTDRAERALRKALSLSAHPARAYAELAALYEDTNRLAECGTTVREGLQSWPDDARLNLEAAKLARREGDPASAIRRLENFELCEMDERLARMYSYELGLNQDRVGAHDAAFESFRQANLHARKNERLQDVDAARFLAKIDKAQAFFEATEPRAWRPAPPLQHAEPPVFLFGFPRSGTTLTDLLLDNHPEIVTLEEKPTVEKLVIRLLRHEAGYPAVLERLVDEEIVALRRDYFMEVDLHTKRDPHKLVVDKMPIRTVNAGLIWRLFPDSKIIFSARHPCDVCLSCFMQQFNANDAFANFFTLADTVRVYDKVMRLWQLYVRKLPVTVHLIRYEDLVSDLEGESRRLMSFLGKAWRPEIMDYRKRALERGRIATNSYHQVTEPLYTRAVGRWQRYATYFQPYLDVLRPHLRFFGYPDV